MVEKAPVFKKIIRDYLQQVAGLENPGRACEALGVTAENGVYRIDFFHRPYTVGTDGIAGPGGGPASHVTGVVLCKYLLMCPNRPSQDTTLVTYKDFKDAAPYVGGFRNTTENPIADLFGNDVPGLAEKCRGLGGRPFDTEVSCQLAYRFQALPKVPVFLLFNEADEDFPAQCVLLFRKNAADYLDMECLAMVGSTLMARLRGRALYED